MDTQIRDYETFKQVAQEEIINYLPEKMKHADVVIIKENISSRNIVQEHLMIQEPIMIFPKISLNQLYQDFLNTKDMAKVLKEISNMLQESIANQEIYEQEVFPEDEEKKENIKKNVYTFLLSTENDKLFLAEHPHRQWHEVSIVYYCLFGKNTDNPKIVWVTEKYANFLGITSEQELYELANKNSLQSKILELLREEILRKYS